MKRSKYTRSSLRGALVIFALVGIVLLGGGLTGIRDLPSSTFIDYSMRRGSPSTDQKGDEELREFSSGAAYKAFIMTALGASLLTTSLTAGTLLSLISYHKQHEHELHSKES